MNPVLLTHPEASFQKFHILSVTDWQKTPGQKHREKLLLDELVGIVNKRDELVQHLDNQEKA